LAAHGRLDRRGRLRQTEGDCAISTRRRPPSLPD
jgi:hypothetical protein